MSFWHDIPTASGKGIDKNYPNALYAYRLLGLLNALLSTHGKTVVVWETGRPELDTPRLYYISRLEVCTINKYKDEE
jgi:hypothetical protein